MASIKRNKYSVLKVINSKGRVICYLSEKDMENGMDTEFDMAGYTVVSI